MWEPAPPFTSISLGLHDPLTSSLVVLSYNSLWGQNVPLLHNMCHQCYWRHLSLVIKLWLKNKTCHLYHVYLNSFIICYVTNPLTWWCAIVFQSSLYSFLAAVICWCWERILRKLICWWSVNLTKARKHEHLYWAQLPFMQPFESLSTTSEG